jgi:hypothetical protein
MHPILRKVNSFLFILSFASVVSAQQVHFGFNTGLGTYQMEELKRFNNNYINQLPFEAVNVDDYPPWIYYKQSLEFAWDRIMTGITLGFYSTGARFSMADYTGKYQFDSKIKSAGPGFWFGAIANPLNKFQVIFTGEIGFLRTKLVIDESFELFEESEVDDNYVFKSWDTIIEPGVKFQFPVALFLFEYYLAYAMQIDGKGLVKNGQSAQYELYIQGESVNPGWNGLRTGLGVLINLSPK